MMLCFCRLAFASNSIPVCTIFMLCVGTRSLHHSHSGLKSMRTITQAHCERYGLWIGHNGTFASNILAICLWLLSVSRARKRGEINLKKKNEWNRVKNETHAMAMEWNRSGRKEKTNVETNSLLLCSALFFYFFYFFGLIECVPCVIILFSSFFWA